jgi:putative ABC transport system ATP-binding protein
MFITCQKITKSFKKGDQLITPLQELSIELEKGSFTALMGPSGSGKTTLLNLLAGIDSPSSGRLEVAGTDITKLSRSQLGAWRARNIGYIFQLYHLVPVLTAYENIELPLLLLPLSAAERHKRVCTALDLVSLSDRAEHFPRQLSGGQEQRVAIARAIVSDPPLLVADEPTGDLDAESAKAILVLLRQLVSDLGKTIVMVTHDAKAAAVADRILHLEKGQLV